MAKLMYHPPVPTGFEAYELHNYVDGIFVKNVQDNLVFKWISTRDLISNGIDMNGNSCQYGRRSFNSFSVKNLEDPESAQFELTNKKYGGFYISINKFPSRSKSEAEKYVKQYLHGHIDAISALPSGEAYDCLFEHIYEKFREYMLSHKVPTETPYECWNRLVKENEIVFSQYIYGLYGLMDGHNEHTSEKLIGNRYHIYRSETRMTLFSVLQTPTNIEEAYWFLGNRGFCKPGSKEMDFRIMVLPH